MLADNLHRKCVSLLKLAKDDTPEGLNALEKLKAILSKHGLDYDDFIASSMETEVRFRFLDEDEKKICFSIVGKVLGHETMYCIEDQDICFPANVEDAQLLYVMHDMYLTAWNKEKDKMIEEFAHQISLMLGAFAQKNGIAREAGDGEKTEMSFADMLHYQSMHDRMPQVDIRKRLGNWGET